MLQIYNYKPVFNKMLIKKKKSQVTKTEYSPIPVIKEYTYIQIYEYVSMLSYIQKITGKQHNSGWSDNHIFLCAWDIPDLCPLSQQWFALSFMVIGSFLQFSGVCFVPFQTSTLLDAKSGKNLIYITIWNFTKLK